MSTKRPRDETDDGGMDVEVQPERRRKLENDTQNKEGESFLPELPKRSSEDTKSYVFFKAFTLTQIVL